jgi:nicotinamidase-related amidase
MGSLTPEVATLLGTCTHKSVDKLTFSAAANQQFTDELEKLHREQLLICGLETHICVTQTALDLAHLDYQVHCAADAVSSRTFEQHKLGMEKLRDCGILSSSAEGAVMELLYEAGSEEFKSILRLMK